MKSLVSALMVTQPSRAHLAIESIDSFRRQTHPDKELVIVHDGDASFHGQLKWATQDLLVNLVQIPEKRTLGALRNETLLAAQGDLLVQWDDDDLCHPTRIAVQRDDLLNRDLFVSTLNSQYYWFVDDHRVGVRWNDFIPGTVMFRRNASCFYPEWGEKAIRGEDNIFFAMLKATGPDGVLSLSPKLYLRRFHGNNTWHKGHHERRVGSTGLTIRTLVASQALIMQELAEWNVKGVTVFGKDGDAFQIP